MFFEFFFECVYIMHIGYLKFSTEVCTHTAAGY